MQTKSFLQADTRKSTAILKKYLREKYGINASIKSKFYSGGSSLNISYTGGISKHIIEREISHLQYGSFDGMTDLYEYNNSAENGLIIDGYKLETFKYVFINQDVSDFRKKIAFAFSEKFRNYAEAHQLNNEEDYEKNFPSLIGNAWNLVQLIYQNFNKLSFVTDKAELIEITDILQDAENYGYFAKYVFNGKEYTTNDHKIQIKEPTIKKEPRNIVNDIILIDYSEKAIAVIGDTYEIREGLKNLGGKFNKFLTVEGEKKAGWIFNKSQADKVSDLLIQYSKID